MADRGCSRVAACHCGKLSADPDLIVVLHGDAPTRNPTYQYELECRAAATLDDVVVVGLFADGFKDGLGGESEGRRGHALGDNYNREKSIALRALQRR